MNGPAGKAEILVVDDTPANLQLLTGMLKGLWIQVRPALSGELALRAARHTPPDLVLLDITMPGLSGYDVAAELNGTRSSKESRSFSSAPSRKPWTRCAPSPSAGWIT